MGQCPLSKSAHNAELGGAVCAGTGSADGSAATQGHLDRLEKWTNKKLSKFNKGRHQILHHAPEQAWG